MAPLADPAFADVSDLSQNLLILAGASLLFGALLGQRGLVLLGLTTLLLLGLLALLARLTIAGLEVERRLRTRALEEEEVAVELSVTNRGWLTAHLAAVIDHFPPDKSPHPRVSFAAPLASGVRRRSGYRGSCYNKRGRYLIGPATLLVRDPLGLFGASLRCASRDELLVLPAVPPLLSPRPAPALDAPTAWLGEHASSRPGEGYDLQGIRGYRPGDPARSIHWRLSAHRHELLVKELDHVTPRRTLFALDMSVASLRGLGRHSTHEYALRAALAMLRQALSGRELAGLLARTEPPLVAPDRCDLEGLFPILEALALARPSSDTRPLRGWLMDHAGDLGRSRGQPTAVVLITASAGPDLAEIQELRGWLRSLGVSLHLHLIDGSSFRALEVLGASPERERQRVLAAARELAGAGLSLTLQRNGEALEQALARGIPGAPRIRIRERNA